ncbi:MAG: hypothetical protein ACPKQO_02130 [Nitrososphaeraceae archaeon]
MNNKTPSIFEFRVGFNPLGLSGSNSLLNNRTLICYKNIEVEINQIDLVDENFVRVNVGITKILFRCYDISSKKTKLWKELIHIGIIFVTTISLVLAINHNHNNILGLLESGLLS